MRAEVPCSPLLTHMHPPLSLILVLPRCGWSTGTC